MKRQVLGLYAQCLRSARRCPEWTQREMMKAYVRMKFRAEVGTRDPDRVRWMLADAREELERMDYFHSVYAEKQRLKAARDQPSHEGEVEDGKEAEVAAESRKDACPLCGTLYQPAEAKFCSNCGERRQQL
jgi:hypothetical protein